METLMSKEEERLTIENADLRDKISQLESKLTSCGYSYVKQLELRLLEIAELAKDAQMIIEESKGTDFGRTDLITVLDSVYTKASFTDEYFSKMRDILGRKSHAETFEASKAEYRALKDRVENKDTYDTVMSKLGNGIVEG